MSRTEIQPQTEKQGLLTMREAAAMLGISLRKMYDLAAPAGPIPCYRLGKRITRFDKKDVQAFIDARRIEQFNPVKEAGPAKIRTVIVKASDPEDPSGLLALFREHRAKREAEKAARARERTAKKKKGDPK